MEPTRAKKVAAKYAPLVVLPPIAIGSFLYGLEIAESLIFPGVVALIMMMLTLLPVAIALTYVQLLFEVDGDVDVN